MLQPDGGGAINVDLGDITAVFELRIKGRQRYGWTLRVGTPRDTTASDRVVKGPPYAQTPGKVDLIMDLQADKKVTLTGTWTDELEHPVPAPDGATAVFTVDDPTIIALTEIDALNTEAAATGVLGNAVVHGVASVNGVEVATADVLFTVVAGDAERFTIAVSEPTEVTPDEA